MNEKTNFRRTLDYSYSNAQCIYLHLLLKSFPDSNKSFKNDEPVVLSPVRNELQLFLDLRNICECHGEEITRHYMSLSHLSEKSPTGCLCGVTSHTRQHHSEHRKTLDFHSEPSQPGANWTHFRTGNSENEGFSARSNRFPLISHWPQKISV